MIPEIEPASLLQYMVATGNIHVPIDHGTPTVIDDLAPNVESLSDLLVADRRKERDR